MKQASAWELPHPPSFPPVSKDMYADVLIIGGGITGVTAAYLVAKTGRSVVLLEKNRLCSGETGHTTAHISYPTDLRLSDLVKSFGRNHAEAVWDACFAAAEEIRHHVCAEKIDCGLRHVPGYLYAAADAGEAELERLQRDVALANEMGFDASYVVGCPVTGRPAARFANLMKFHPTRYVTQLAAAAVAHGCHIHEDSEAAEFNGDERSVQCNGRRISYHRVLIATHVPLQGGAGTVSAALLQTKRAGYSTYALQADIEGRVPEALWWDTSDPYLYLRSDATDDGVKVIIGGEDHKTGQSTDTEACYTALSARLHALFPAARVTHRWSGQVIETVDGLPYIGEHAGQFIATGFSGTGITYGTLAAMMFLDHVQGITNPWTELFRVERKELSGSWSYVKENKDYPYYLAKSVFMGESRDPASLAADEGAVLRLHGQKVAASKDAEGQLTLLSAVCPHMGCVVTWNAADRTWDCPCHGSRFAASGAVIAGPAESPLELIANAK
ncbi:MAG: FAD-dependent oxidoreductase [Prosthecobacter sp.]|jgi:glycine/D-amino acid oxidase-like deaminating enzyme/nitrite reductase/ring-hydroxylating ferredoxin subunit|uniref:FAD-dependent oxidoreductase n=1 Tax=Prosthecobacter sp. TaxID=1965333 RepID=UPI0019DD533D|nr:FAD-dependent oxidoreductase [Prosthecobacter sp.]MBE2287601.1 FAD-dependent oxidoreductase [Prosthecobacter sp.]